MSTRIYSSYLYREGQTQVDAEDNEGQSMAVAAEPSFEISSSADSPRKPIIRFCSRQFREELRALYPGLDAKPDRWLFLQFLIYCQHFDFETDKLVASAKVVSEWMGRQGAFHGKNFSVRDVVEDFSEHVFPVALSGYVYEPSRGKCESRIVLSKFPKEVEEFWERERRSRHTPRVEFATGKKAVNPRLNLVSTSAPEASRIMVEYMNALPTNRFSKAVAAHWLEAAALAATLGEMHTPAGRQSAILTQLLTNPKPLYKTAENSARIFSATDASLANLKRCVRDVLCQDWLKCDLASAQYSINYRVWGMEEAGVPFVDSPFDTLIADIGLSPDARPALKKIIYSICFGMSTRRNPSRENICDLANAVAPNLWCCLKSHPLIKGLLETRRAQFKQIRDTGFALDAWNNPILLEPDAHDGLPGDNVRSVLAQVAQSYEQRLMFEVYRLAIQNPGKHGFSIMVNVYDGLYICVNDASECECWKKRISSAVENEAFKLGIKTQLEWE